MIFTEATYILSTTSKLSVRRDTVDLPLAFLLSPQRLYTPALPEETQDTTHSKGRHQAEQSSRRKQMHTTKEKQGSPETDVC